MVKPVLSFDYGLQQLPDEPAAGEAYLPDRFALSPSEEQPRPRLEELVRPLGFEDRIYEFLKPMVTDPEILTPNRYEALLQTALAGLCRLPCDADPVLKRAVDLLREENDSR